MSGHAEANELAVTSHALEVDTDNRNEQRAADRRRAAKLRERREQAGQVRIQAWVPRQRAAYARQILRTAVAGANALPPDPEQQAELDAARAETAAVKAELEAARAANDCQVQQAQSAEAAALTRAEEAERGREKTAYELAAARAEVQIAQEREWAARKAVEALRGKLEEIKSRGGWRGVLLRLANTGSGHGLGSDEITRANTVALQSRDMCN